MLWEILGPKCMDFLPPIATAICSWVVLRFAQAHRVEDELEGLGSLELLFKARRPGSWEHGLDVASWSQILHLIIKLADLKSKPGCALD